MDAAQRSAGEGQVLQLFTASNNDEQAPIHDPKAAVQRQHDACQKDG